MADVEIRSAVGERRGRQRRAAQRWRRAVSAQQRIQRSPASSSLERSRLGHWICAVIDQAAAVSADRHDVQRDPGAPCRCYRGVKKKRLHGRVRYRKKRIYISCINGTAGDPSALHEG